MAGKREHGAALPKVASVTSVIDLGAEPPQKKAKKEKKEKKEKESVAEVAGPSAAEFLAEHEITIHDKSAPPPCLTFASAPFSASLIKVLMSQPFSTPSAVQAAAWPLAAQGRDVLAIAKTGSGKTLGFLLPAIEKCMAAKGAAGGYPIVLVMAPTRELVLQIKSEADKFGQPVGVRSVAVYGGAPKWAQTQALHAGAEIVCATPGRMMDMLDLHGVSWSGASTNLEKCSMLVLDEADRMLDMGFEKDIRAIVEPMPPHQTLFFTATWPKAVQRVAADIMDDTTKVMVTVGSGGEKLTANKAVEQRVQVIEQRDKWAALEQLLAPYKPGGAQHGQRVILFSNTKRDVNMIGQHCWETFGECVDTISGDRSQKERERTIAAFRDGQVTMVVATDVAARGLDINGIHQVINYDFPGPDDYIHRIGRTGRAGAKGVADTLFVRGDAKHARELARILSDAGQLVPPALASMTGGGGKGGGGKGGGGKGGGGKGKGKGGGGWGGGGGMRW